jgi:hypothetical protein
MAIENVLLVGPRTLSEVRLLVEQTLGAASLPGGDGAQILTAAGTLVGIYPADYIDEPGLKLEQYEYVVDANGPEQRTVAEQVFEAAERRWQALWLTDSSVQRASFSARHASA